MKVIENVLRKAGLLKKGENVFIIYDEEKEEIANLFFKSCERLGAEVYSSKILRRGESKREPPKAVAEAMKFSDLILAITSVSLTHSKAIREARNNARIASMPGITKEMFPALNIDYKKMRKECESFAKNFSAEEIRIKTRLGTDLTLRCGGRDVQVQDGILDKVGSLHNWPAGEVGIAPLENSANGKIVFDVCFTGIGKLKRPLSMEVKKGEVAKIYGYGAEKLKEILKKAGKNSRIVCEFSVGMNKKARIMGNVLNDEKVHGTCHVAIGDNKSIGGLNESKVHLDGVIKAPTVSFDKEVLIEEGVLV